MKAELDHGFARRWEIRVMHLERVLLADGIRIGLESTYLPLHRFADLVDDFDPTGSLYAAIRASGVTFGAATERIETVLPSPREAALLESTITMPMLLLNRRSVDTDGVPIDWCARSIAVTGWPSKPRSPMVDGRWRRSAAFRYEVGMRLADRGALSAGVEAIRATAGALLGWPGDLFSADGETFGATLTIDEDARVPRSVALLRPGSTHRALVQVGPERRGAGVRKLCVKIPDAHGPGRDQDFLMASSGDGAPMHHAALPTDSVASLYSTLWLYLAGLQPVLFGVLASTTGRDLRFGSGDELSFAISPPVGQFRRIGALTLTGPDDVAVRFAGRHSGGNIWPLPPVTFY